MYLNRIKALMSMRGCTVAQLAELTGMPRHRLYRKLRGESEFRLTEMAAIARVLDCDPGNLFFGPLQAHVS